MVCPRVPKQTMETTVVASAIMAMQVQIVRSNCRVRIPATDVVPQGEHKQQVIAGASAIAGLLDQIVSRKSHAQTHAVVGEALRVRWPMGTVAAHVTLVTAVITVRLSSRARDTVCTVG